MATAEVPCGCRHSRWRHLADHGRCQARYCQCIRFRAPAPLPNDEEAAVLHRIENTRPAPESWRPDGDDEPIPARFDERYDPSPDPIERRIS